MAARRARYHEDQLTLSLPGTAPPEPLRKRSKRPSRKGRLPAKRFRGPPPIPRWDAQKIRTVFTGVADKKLIERFIEYHLGNEDVYVDFVERSFRALFSGRLRYSQWTIIQSIRWDRDMTIRGTEVFKINNDFIALYVRMAISDFPLKLQHFFELRKMKPVGRKMSREETRRRDEEDELYGTKAV